MLKEHSTLTSELEQYIIELLTHILTKNAFTFNNEHFVQIYGTAMGSPMASTYANIFMARLERELLLKAPNGLIPIEWIRFIDDIFAIWTHGIEKLQQVLTYINKFHPTIKFGSTYSRKTVNFLDTTIYTNSNNKFESDLYIKSTDRTILLLLLLLLLLRCRCIISDNSKLHERLNHLLVALIHWGYKYDTIVTAFNKALEYNTQDELLSMQTTHKTNNRPIFPHNIQQQHQIHCTHTKKTLDSDSK